MIGVENQPSERVAALPDQAPAAAVAQYGASMGDRRQRGLPARTAVVVSGAAILVVETIATRLVAPYVGLTLESYTAAIGVALLGIAVGARLGGLLADKVAPNLVAAGALLAGGALVLLVRPLVLLLGPSMPPGALSAVFLVAVSTLPAVLVLAMVAPAAVKHRLRDLGESGHVVGELSALGTLGALAGTFLTGFVLVATLPTWQVLAVAGAACVAVGLATARAARVPPANLGAAAMVVALAATSLTAVRSPCDVETGYFCATVVVDPDRPTGRILRLDNLRHSYVDVANPAYLEFEYIKNMAAVVDATFAAGRPLDALHVGAGGFTMPRWLEATRPGSKSTVLEIDRGVVRLGRQQLGVDGIAGLTVRVGDGRISLRSQPDRSADLIVLDAFGSLSVPWHLATREFLTDVARVLRPGGVIVSNVIDNGPRRLLAAEARTLAAVVPHTALLARPEQLAAGGGGNFILVGAHQPVPAEAVDANAARLGEPSRALTGAAYREISQAGILLRDDFAPVDQLLTPRR